MTSMTLLHLHWLFLAVPLGVALWLWPPPSRLQRVLRFSSFLLLLLALAGLALDLPSRAGTVIVVADRSASMPGDSETSQKEIVELLQRQMSSLDLLGVVSFGQRVAIDRAPQTGQFTGFQREVGRDASQLADALEQALGLVPRDAPGRILVLSDGRWTGRDPASIASWAAARQVAIDYRCLERTRANDLAIDHIDAPSAVAPGESFLITGWIQCPSPQKVAYELRDRNRLIAKGEQHMASGLQRLTFRDRADEGGNHAYTLTVQGEGYDPVQGNNQARVLVGIEGPKPILHVGRTTDSGLAKLLQKGGLKVQLSAPEACRWTIEDLTRYSALLLENVPAEMIGHNGMETLATWVKQTGAGLMMTGGRESYGPGGYHKSVLDPILPVSMELRHEHRELSVAIVVALDRSGSMALPVAGGRTKMDLANLGTIEVLNLLSPTSEFGCIAIDTVPHTIAPLAKVTDKAATAAKIRKIESMGGGIYVYEALVAASKMISTATAGTKHIVLFSDANDSEEAGDYQPLLEKITRAGITVSVIGLGKNTDKDGALLEDIAKRGKGRCFFTDKAEELPRLFVQDTFVIARNTFLDEKVGVKETAGLALLTGRGMGLDTQVGGYNLCYLRPEANLAGLTLDKYKAPLVASWNSGTGRVLCYTGEADGKYAGPIKDWDHVGDFYTSLVRWVAGQSGPLPDNMMLRQEVKNGVKRVQLLLDPERKKESFTGLPKATVLTSEPGRAPRARTTELRWTGADTLMLEVPLLGSETALTTVEVPGQKPIVMPPVCLPYSPELRPFTGESGRTALDHLARATGGRERDVGLHKIWSDLPRRPRLIVLTQWLLLLVVVLVLLEVLERRTGLLSSPRWLMRSTREERQAKHAAARPATNPVAPPVPVAPSPEPTPQPQAAGEPSAMVDALRQARERTRARMD
jgi:Mg-chelatase subunit ChlD